MHGAASMHRPRRVIRPTWRVAQWYGQSSRYWSMPATARCLRRNSATRWTCCVAAMRPARWLSGYWTGTATNAPVDRVPVPLTRYRHCPLWMVPQWRKEIMICTWDRCRATLHRSEFEHNGAPAIEYLDADG